MTRDPEQVPRGLVGALLLTAALNPLNSTMIAVALPDIATTFAASSGTVTTWLVTSYLLVNIVGVSPAGHLGDLIGRRRALSLGQLILALGAILGGLSPTFAGVALGRIVMAAGGAIVIPASMAMLRETFAPERRARVFAALGALMGVAAAIGPVIGGVLTARVGWHAIFLVNAPLLILAWLLAREPRASPATGGGRESPTTLADFDLVGAALLVAGLGAIAIGLRMAAWRSSMIPAGSLTLLAFILWEKRSPAPLIDLRLFRERHFVAAGAVIALQNLSMYALMFQLPFLLSGPMGIGAERGGRILMTMMVAMVVTAPIGGRISERIGVRLTVALGLAAGAAGLLFGLRAVTTHELTPLRLCLAGLGLGLGFVGGPAQAAALSAISSGRSGVASGVLSTMRYLGGIIGVSIISVLLDGGGEAKLSAGHRECLWIYFAAHVLAIGVGLLLPGRLGTKEGVA